MTTILLVFLALIWFSFIIWLLSSYQRKPRQINESINICGFDPNDPRRRNVYQGNNYVEIYQ
jgi:hypothetical protein